MRIGATLEGGAALRQTLEKLPAAVTADHQRKALSKGAELIRSEAAALAPRGQGEHIAEHIIVDPLTDAELDRAEEVVGAHAAVLVGPERRFFYGYFLEYGTSKMPAQPFMRPAFDTKVRPALTVALSHLWNSILAMAGRSQQHGSIGGRNL